MAVTRKKRAGRREGRPDAAGDSMSAAWRPGRVAQACLLFVAVALVYARSAFSEFIWDDDDFVFANPLNLASNGLWRFWFSTDPPDYFPLTSSMLWIEWRLFGMNPMGYHVINILLHAASTVFIWMGLDRLRLPGAWIAALLFGIHPVCAESVAWITERKNTLSMFFYALSMMLYVRWDGERARRWYAASLAAFLLALLSKTSVAMMPVALTLFTWWRHRTLDWRRYLHLVPFYALALALALVTIWFQSQRAIATDVVRTDTFAARMATAGWCVWFYVYKALLPLNLGFCYPRWEIDAGTPLNWAPLAALATVFAGLAAARGEWRRHVLAGFGAFTVSLFPVLGFFDIYFMSYSLVSDHWQYVALPFLVILAVCGVARLLADRSAEALRAGAVAGAVCALLFAAVNWQVQGIYSSRMALWTATLAQNPNARLAHNNISTMYEGAGELDKALHHIDEAIRLKPDEALSHYNRGNILDKLGRLDEAIAATSRSLALRFHCVEAQQNMGKFLSKAGRHEQAVPHLLEALRLDPQYAPAMLDYGNLLMQTGRLDRAIEQFRAAIGAKPDYAEAHNNLGDALLKQGNVEGAARAFRGALDINPDDAIARYNYGAVLERQGRLREALEQFRRAAEINPGWPPPANKVRQLEARLGAAGPAR